VIFLSCQIVNADVLLYLNGSCIVFVSLGQEKKAEDKKKAEEKKADEKKKKAEVSEPLVIVVSCKIVNDDALLYLHVSVIVFLSDRRRRPRRRRPRTRRRPRRRRRQRIRRRLRRRKRRPQKSWRRNCRQRRRS
jgi:hypothetical protein